MDNVWKIVFTALGGAAGWFVAVFEPTFPLIAVAIAFILYDAWTAFQLDQRVHAKFPERRLRERAHFTSFAFGKVVKQTIPERLWLIVLAFMAEHWVFPHIWSLPLSYVVTGVICFEQFWSVLENMSSCREDGEGRVWKLLQRVMVDKTSRHFDIDLKDLSGED